METSTALKAIWIGVHTDEVAIGDDIDYYVIYKVANASVTSVTGDPDWTTSAKSFTIPDQDYLSTFAVIVIAVDNAGNKKLQISPPLRSPSLTFRHLKKSLAFQFSPPPLPSLLIGHTPTWTAISVVSTSMSTIPSKQMALLPTRLHIPFPD